MELRIARSALADMQEIKDYYTELGAPQVGKSLLEKILKQCHVALDHPDSGRIVPEFSTPALREFIQPPFRIVYLREPALITIIRVWRSERMLKLPDDPVK